uniref:Uncharacterized protein n=1 Tax=Rousettus aegyptiacus TaxID=9407 RepID=A0A7J8CIT6_ROUAE|nr:hypothetical protein HJG63_009218 [Rousettus aegyptiacus]
MIHTHTQHTYTHCTCMHITHTVHACTHDTHTVHTCTDMIRIHCTHMQTHKPTRHTHCTHMHTTTPHTSHTRTYTTSWACTCVHTHTASLASLCHMQKSRVTLLNNLVTQGLQEIGEKDPGRPERTTCRPLQPAPQARLAALSLCQPQVFTDGHSHSGHSGSSSPDAILHGIWESQLLQPADASLAGAWSAAPPGGRCGNCSWGRGAIPRRRGGGCPGVTLYNRNSCAEPCCLATGADGDSRWGS